MQPSSVMAMEAQEQGAISFQCEQYVLNLWNLSIACYAINTNLQLESGRKRLVLDKTFVPCK